MKYGVYKPTTNTTNRIASFVIDHTMNLYGGFIGNETSLNDRNLYTNPPSILSGDIDSNDNGGSNGVDADASQIV
ncbi:hypothetical protein RSW78_25550, partial [Escherichia coli]